MNKTVILNCLNCKNSFTVYRSQRNRKFCSKKCADLNKSNGLTAICQKCGKFFSVAPSNKTTAKFCSKNCRKPELLNKKCPTCKKIFKVLPAYKSRKFCKHECFSSNQNIRQKMAENRRNQVITEKQLKALEKGRCWAKGKTKENNPSIAKRAKKLSEKFSTSEYRKYLSERMKKFFSENPEKHPHFIFAQKGYESSLEKRMRFALESRKILFEKQFNIDRFWVDFAIVLIKLAIEVDGEYWHNKEKDTRRDKIIESYGWKVIRFSEKQIKSDIESCLNEIQEAISIFP